MPWQRFFEARQCLTLRRGRGAGDLVLWVEDTEIGPRLSVWDVREDVTRPVTGKVGDAENAVLTAAGDAVLSHHSDDDGSEMGHVMATCLATGTVRDLTPGLPPYTLRGIDVAREGDQVVLTAVAADGFSLWLVAGGPPRRLFTSRNEAWNGLISADGTLVSVDTTDHDPSLRRFGVTVLDPASGTVLAFLSDGPASPVRAVRFSPVPGDPRLLVSTERSGFARPCVWNPLDGSRLDVGAPHLVGDVVPLDWSDDAAYVLLAHVDGGVHRMLELDVRTGEVAPVDHPSGAYFEPDVAATHLNIWASHYGQDGIRLLRQRFDIPLTVLDVDRGSGATTLRRPGSAPAGVRAVSRTIRSADGTALQLWTCVPPGATAPGPLVLYLHGGPNMVTVDRYNAQAQTWLDEGVGYAALNYRGSVTFGREFREGFRPSLGDRELEDLNAAVQWLVAEGMAAKDQVFVTGVSYGGYLSLLAMGRAPHLFAGALAFVPMADWLSAYNDQNPAQQRAWRYFMGGFPDEVPDKYRRASPITYVGDVRAPVWISHATHDTRCPPRQVHEYALSLERAGGDVVLDWFTGGHETSSRDQAIADQRRMLELVRSALRGERWSTGPVTPPPGW
ncbi:peptide hydrolase [Acrocarpospora pleiomorpha]|uniref:Peptide hydrolase n=1 Tax=Acrocarpospora pleiomorpha TaxID=90975 RepID=A0A5M3XGW7_9ACTN|nr:peptide hydrolase [Acrocarpospora pleiomorpha]